MKITGLLRYCTITFRDAAKAQEALEPSLLKIKEVVSIGVHKQTGSHYLKVGLSRPVTGLLPKKFEINGKSVPIHLEVIGEITAQSKKIAQLVFNDLE